MKIIETERLYLRELVIGDTRELCKVLSDPESMQYYPEPFNQKKVENWIQWNIDNYKKYNHGLWAVILKDGEKYVKAGHSFFQNHFSCSPRSLSIKTKTAE